MAATTALRAKPFVVPVAIAGLALALAWIYVGTALRRSELGLPTDDGYRALMPLGLRLPIGVGLAVGATGTAVAAIAAWSVAKRLATPWCGGLAALLALAVPAFVAALLGRLDVAVATVLLSLGAYASVRGSRSAAVLGTLGILAGLALHGAPLPTLPMPIALGAGALWIVGAVRLGAWARRERRWLAPSVLLA